MTTRSALVLRLVAAAVIGVGLGAVSAYWMPQGTALVTIPWGVVALALGATCGRGRSAILVGGVLGFVAAYAYLVFDDTTLPSGGRLAMLLLIILAPAAFGLCCGAVLAWVGFLVKRAIARRRGADAARASRPNAD